MFRLNPAELAGEPDERHEAVRQLAERAGPRDVTLSGDVLREALDTARQQKPPRKPAKPKPE